MTITLVNALPYTNVAILQPRHFVFATFVGIGCQNINRSPRKHLKNLRKHRKMDDIIGAFEVLYQEDGTYNDFLEDNKELIFRGNNDCFSDSCTVTQTGNQSINIEVNATFGFEKKGESQIDYVKHAVSSNNHKENEKGTCMIAIHTGEILTGGRTHQNCKIIFRDSTVSLRHFTVWGTKFDSDSTPLVYLRDISLNGMMVNGERTERNQTVLLYDGDHIEVRGVISFIFRELEGENQLQRPSSRMNQDCILKGWAISNRILGSGSFGSVFVANSNLTRKLFAVKVIKNLGSTIDSTVWQERFRNESDILLKIQHVS